MSLTNQLCIGHCLLRPSPINTASNNMARPLVIADTMAWLLRLDISPVSVSKAVSETSKVEPRREAFWTLGEDSVEEPG